MADYKEGVDFEYVLSKNQPKGGTNKTRRFFTKAEKEALKAPKAAPKSMAKPTPKPTAKSPTKTTAKDPMKGYRAGDVKTSRLPEDLGKDTRKVLSETGSKAFKMPKRPITSERLAGRLNKANVTALQAYTQEEYDAMTPAQRAAKNLPRSTSGYAMPAGTFKSGAKTSKTTTTSSLGNPMGDAYAKGGMVKKKKAC